MLPLTGGEVLLKGLGAEDCTAVLVEGEELMPLIPSIDIFNHGNNIGLVLAVIFLVF